MHPETAALGLYIHSISTSNVSTGAHKAFLSANIYVRMLPHLCKQLHLHSSNWIKIRIFFKQTYPRCVRCYAMATYSRTYSVQCNPSTSKRKQCARNLQKKTKFTIQFVLQRVSDAEKKSHTFHTEAIRIAQTTIDSAHEYRRIDWTGPAEGFDYKGIPENTNIKLLSAVG